MALQVRVAPSKVVLQNLLICVVLFYTVYYVVLSMGCMVLQVYELGVLAPFDFKIRPSWLNTSYKVLLLSTEVTYFVCGLLFILVVEEWVWDYAISVTVLHVAITSTVMLEFPLASHWWAALEVRSLRQVSQAQIKDEVGDISGDCCPASQSGAPSKDRMRLGCFSMRR